jgi:hypothetical protein
MNEYARIDYHSIRAFCGLMTAGVSPIIADIANWWVGVVVLAGGACFFFYHFAAIGRS